MSEDKTQLAISRGARAKALLEDDILKEVFATMEQTYLDRWRNTKVAETDARERLWQAVNLVGLVRDHLGYVVNDGKIAQAELNKIAATKSR